MSRVCSAGEALSVDILVTVLVTVIVTVIVTVEGTDVSEKAEEIPAGCPVTRPIARSWRQNDGGEQRLLLWSDLVAAACGWLLTGQRWPVDPL